MTKQFALILCLTMTCAATTQADQLYKWVDENGVVHYGDAIPASASSNERHVLNEHGVTVRVLQRAKSREELDAMAASAAEVERQRTNKRMQEERDQILLDTYLSEEEIEMLRDRRILAIEARIGLTRHYLDNLRERWDELETDAGKYNFPYDPDSNLKPLPEELAEHIVFTENAMAEHMDTLQDLRKQQITIHNEFEASIERFRMLKERENEVAQRRPE